MKIVYLATGAGAMYCGSCLQSHTLVAALRAAGEEALLVPLYTPLRTDEENGGIERIAFGGLNVYLQQRWPLFRHTPALLDQLLDHPALLRWLGRRSFSTRPERLGALTVSVLRGEDGYQRKELRKLARWLKHDLQPDIVHLSNALLAGMAPCLRRQLDVPVVCTLAGEDSFIEKLAPPHDAAARSVLRQRAEELDALVAMNHYYAGFMAEYLGIDRRNIHVVPPGINLTGHGRPPERSARPSDPLTIGFLARLCPPKGLHLLAEAFQRIARCPDLPPARLLAAGYLGPDDRPYLKTIQKQLARAGLAHRFQYVGQVDRPGKITFLQSLDVMSVPAIHPESKGLPILEGWANQVPVVLPNHGAFSELVADTGGGLLFRPGDPKSLANRLRQLMLDPDQAAQCGRLGQSAVRQRYHAELMAKRTAALYRKVLDGSRSETE